MTEQEGEGHTHRWKRTADPSLPPAIIQCYHCLLSTNYVPDTERNMSGVVPGLEEASVWGSGCKRL